MKEYKDINNTRYVISRVFGKTETTASLIENKLMKGTTSIYPLTHGDSLVYNADSGSIQSKEVL